MTDGSPDAPGLEEWADRVLGESPADRAALDDPDFLALALAAAAADLALSEPAAADLPQRLRDRVAARLGGSSSRPSSSATARRLAWAGWVAAAVCLLVAALAWRGTTIATPPSIERQWAALRALVRPTPLAATDHPLATGAAGEMLWSAADQRGFLSVRGLAEVNPAQGIYQLWIFDAERDARYPVDGGIFAVADAARPTIVPIRPTLRVRKPTLFAVTLEPAGGVVVSDRKRIMLTGSL